MTLRTLALIIHKDFKVYQELLRRMSAFDMHVEVVEENTHKLTDIASGIVRKCILPTKDALM